MEKSKKAFFIWKEKGKPKETDNVYYIEMKTRKRELRGQMRKEEYMDKQKFYTNLMENPDSKTFFRLIRKNKANSSDQSTLILRNDSHEEISDPKLQTDLFANFYEELASPLDENHFDQMFLEESQERCDLISNIVNDSIMDKSSITNFNEDDIKKAIEKLNTGKTQDGYGITAEHFKYAGKFIISLIVNLFNSIMRKGETPETFKTGVLTPVHKKGKDPSLTTNYRGITVTSVLGKIFEYALLGKMVNINSDQSELSLDLQKDYPR